MAKAKKRRNYGAKGSKFERDVCRQLTAWWTGDPDADVVFWRTSQSGGRATSRKKARKTTAQAHCGDITAIDPKAMALTKLVTFELKRGNKGIVASDLLDRLKRSKQTAFEAVIQQVMDAARLGKTPFWAVVHQRNSKQTVIHVDQELVDELRRRTGWPHRTKEMAFSGRIKTQSGKQRQVRFTSFLFDQFLNWIEPETIKSIHKERR